MGCGQRYARVHLSFPTAGRAQLVFDTYVPPTITGQSMEVSVNNLIVAKLGEQELAGSKRHVIPLPDDLPRKNVNTIEFTMGKTVRIGSDSRELSVSIHLCRTGTAGVAATGNSLFPSRQHCSDRVGRSRRIRAMLCPFLSRVMQRECKVFSTLGAVCNRRM